MKKKRFGAIVAAGVMSCALVASVATSGCGLAPIYEFTMPENGYDGSKVEITFATTAGQKLLDVIDDAIVRFNEIYPNITVKKDTSSKNYDVLNDKIGTQLTTGKQPSVAFCYSDHVALYNESKAVLPLDQFFFPGSGYEDKTATTANGKVTLGLTTKGENEKAKVGDVEDYVEAFFEEGSVFGDGHTYTIPFAKSTEVLYYNQELFEKHHLTVPTTWDEMAAVCEQILALEEVQKDESIYPLGYDSEANLFITLCEQYGSDYTSATGNHFLFNNDTNKAFVKMLKGWFDKGYFITKATNNDTFSSGLFTDGKCFMSIGSTGGSSYQDPGATDNQAKFTVGVAPLPQVDTTNPQSILQGPSVCIFKKQNPNEVLASWLFVKFLSTDIEFQARYSETSGYMPVTYSTIDSELYQEFLSEGDKASGLTARTANTCIKLIEDKAFYTSPAFTGSSMARSRVEILVTSVLRYKGDDLDKAIDDAFATAIQKCNSYIGN